MTPSGLMLGCGWQVDEMVNTFSELNRGMEQTGTFTMKRKKLFQLVAAANTTLADVILRLGLLERYDHQSGPIRISFPSSGTP